MYSDVNWNSAVHDGTFNIDAEVQSPDYNASVDVSSAIAEVSKRKGGKMQISTYVKVNGYR